MHQLPLVLFTVFIQAACGFMLCFGLARLCAAADNGPDAELPEREPQLLLWGLFLIGIAASFAHLGKPMNAPNIFRGLATGSPLSLEVCAATVFGCFCLIYSILIWKKASPAAKKIALILAMLSGIGLCIALANVYTIPTIPLWDSIWTYVQFFMSVASLGIAGMLFLASRHGQFSHWKFWNIVAFLVLLTLVGCTAGYSGWVSYQVGLTGANLPLGSLPIFRILFQCTAILMLVVAARRESSQSAALYGGIFVCILASELIGRIFFYGLQQVSGMMQIYAY